MQSKRKDINNATDMQEKMEGGDDNIEETAINIPVTQCAKPPSIVWCLCVPLILGILVVCTTVNGWVIYAYHMEIKATVRWLG